MAQDLKLSSWPGPSFQGSTPVCSWQRPWASPTNILRDLCQGLHPLLTLADGIQKHCKAGNEGQSDCVPELPQDHFQPEGTECPVSFSSPSQNIEDFGGLECKKIPSHRVL